MTGMQSSYAHPGRPDGLLLSLTVGGQARRLVIGRTASLGLGTLFAAITIWAAVSGAYVMFHDDLLASLIARQADMQYAYEDQIATLKTDLDRQSSRVLVDRQTIDTMLRDLDGRSAQLEGRATAIERLVDEADGSGTAMPRHRREPASNALGSSSRLEPGATAPAADINGEQRADLTDGAVAARLADVERRQAAALVHLRDPVLKQTRRLAAALAEAGVRRRAAMPAAGGPFVPLDAGHTSFDEQVALTRDAIEQRAHAATLVDQTPLRKPLEGPLEVSSPFGARLDPFYGRAAMHTGVDLLDARGGLVRATASGVVTSAGSAGGYGEMVEIDHGEGLVTRYAHLSAIDVVPGQRVAAGTVVGRVGSTGRATGPHLHYETRVDGEPVNPTRFLNAGAHLVD